MKRCALFGALLAALAILIAWPATADQSGGPRRIGILMGVAADPYALGLLGEFRDRMRDAGWDEGRNLQVDYRWSDGDPAKAQEHAKDLVSLQPDLLIGHTDSAVAALRAETQEIPIVFVTVTDPVGRGFVGSLSRPGGNATGFSDDYPALGGKWLEMLKSVAPHVEWVAVLYDPKTAPRTEALYLPSLQKAAESLKVQTVVSLVQSDDDVRDVINRAGRQRASGLIVVEDSFFTSRTPLIAPFVARHRVPTIHPYSYYPSGGGLVSYGIDPAESFRLAPGYVDRIFNGEKPQDLPVQLPLKFELSINLKVAKELGLAVPATLLSTADKVIE